MTGWTARLLLLAVLLVGCTAVGGPATDPAPTATKRASSQPWPDTWATNVCYALRHLTQGSTALQAAYEDGQNYDFDAATKQATEASGEAKNASDALADATDWKPGSSLVTYLNGAATALRKAANLLKIGIANVDTAALTQANAQIDAGTAQLKRATSAMVALNTRYGFTC